ncbi:MAG: hypothetical protein QOH93_2914, partial [Chloroflexia bacterium]|nr:hypothetical protein [Chloroflexia bacterium]
MRPDSKINRATSGTTRMGLLFLALAAMVVLTASIAFAGAPTRLPMGATGQKQTGAANSASQFALAPSSHCTPTTFTPASGSPYSVDSSPYALASGDFNNDGNPDLVSASNISSTVSVLMGSPTGAMGSATSFLAKAGGGAQSVAVGDFNLDNKQDLVVGNLNTNDISVLLGNGSGSFGAATVFTAGTQIVAVAVGDFNNDNKPDVLVANYGDDNVSVRLNTCAGPCGSPSFSVAPDASVNDGPYFIVVGNFNGDTNLDFATANYNSDSVSVLLG